jgi:hypothetical protein
VAPPGQQHSTPPLARWAGWAAWSLNLGAATARLALSHPSRLPQDELTVYLNDLMLRTGGQIGAAPAVVHCHHATVD